MNFDESFFNICAVSIEKVVTLKENAKRKILKESSYLQVDQQLTSQDIVQTISFGYRPNH